MSLPGLKFNEQHSSDYGLIMRYFIPQLPAPKKIKAEVPFMDSVYDFSTIATNGEKVYGQREVKVGFAILANSKGQLHAMYSNAMRWLIENPQGKLISDYIIDVYFLAEVEDAPDWSEVQETGEFEVTFTAEPFKYGIDLMGELIWDNFNFETDVLQELTFIVAGTKTVDIYNPGRSICPKINASTNMSVVLNGYTLNLVAGDNINYRFRFKYGHNTVAINGTGTLEFIFRKEVF